MPHSSSRGTERSRPLTRCSFCSMSFKKLEHAQRHERTHTHQRPFHCSACPKAFARQDTLNRHFRLHTRDAARKPSRRRVSKSDSLSSLSPPLTTPPRLACSPRPLKVHSVPNLDSRFHPYSSASEDSPSSQTMLASSPPPLVPSSSNPNQLHPSLPNVYFPSLSDSTVQNPRVYQNISHNVVQKPQVVSSAPTLYTNAAVDACSTYQSFPIYTTTPLVNSSPYAFNTTPSSVSTVEPDTPNSSQPFYFYDAHQNFLPMHSNNTCNNKYDYHQNDYFNQNDYRQQNPPGHALLPPFQGIPSESISQNYVTPSVSAATPSIDNPTNDHYHHHHKHQHHPEDSPSFDSHCNPQTSVAASSPIIPHNMTHNALGIDLNNFGYSSSDPQAANIGENLMLDNNSMFPKSFPPSPPLTEEERVFNNLDNCDKNIIPPTATNNMDGLFGHSRLCGLDVMGSFSAESFGNHDNIINDANNKYNI